MRGRLICRFLLLFSIVFGAPKGEDVILKPEKKGNLDIALIYIQGAEIKPEAYVPLAKAIQLATLFPVWIGIPQFPLDIPEPLVLEGGIKRILEKLKEAGMNTTKVFYAGHSLGGAILQEYVKSKPTNVEGQILMGSFLSRKYRNVSYPVSTLTVSGELDGLCRVTRIMEEYFHRITQSSGAPFKFPVVVIEGMNHFEFASGTMPLLVKERDLKAEISFDVAHNQVASYISYFISAHFGNSTAEALLTKAVEATGVFVQPLITAYHMEGSYHFKEPCYDNPPSSLCTLSCPWSSVAASMMGKLERGTVKDKDEFHPVSQIDPVHLPHILKNCSTPSTSCVVETSTVSENMYELGDKPDTGFFSNSASEIRIKIKSRQIITEAAGYKNVSFNVTDGPYNCADINQAGYNWSLSHAGLRTLSRFRQWGVPMVMAKDRGPYNAGPLWILSWLQYKSAKNSTGGEIQEVASATLVTPQEYFIKAAAGMHYCKLLSPARAMEWIYVDGLRYYYSVKSG